ncbi:type II toxin-antitoxin system RelE/ParE family toxin [Lactobacillus sp. AN1001]
MYQIDFYEDKDGYSEIEEYLIEIGSSNQKNDQQIYKKIIYQLNLLELLGNKMTEPQTKFLKGYRYPLMELRPRPERIFYASWAKNRYVLLHHYTKKQNKTDVEEINKALNKLEDWLARKEDGYDNLE